MRLLSCGVYLMGWCAFAQSLQVLPAPPGKASRTFQIMFAAPQGAPVAALQWKVEMAPASAVTAVRITAGTAADEAHKQLNCVEARGAGAASYRCVLSGGASRIPNGAVAVVAFAGTAASGEAAVRVIDTAGASPDARPVRVAGAEATVTLGSSGELSGAPIARR